MTNNLDTFGETMYEWATDLFPICRSITGPGVRETLFYIKNILPDMKIKEVSSGTKVFDWTVPKEWTINSAYIEDSNGKKIIDFKINNLHVVGYSIPIDQYFTLEELCEHLYYLPDQPNAIPYVTSYYKEHWGFCITYKQFQMLKSGIYHVVIDSELKSGVLNYGELVIRGDLDEEVLLSTYVCHPSMANNELSGPVVTTALAQWIQSFVNQRYTYRIIFVPETIGSISYLSINYKYLKRKVIAGFNVTCVGDDRCYSYLPSRFGKTISDDIALHVLQNIDVKFKRYTWLDRGSDERQYCSPGVDLPIATIMRSKYGEYPEYHTSLDDLSLITPKGLFGGFTALRRAIEILENNYYLQAKKICEPQLGNYGLYSTLSIKKYDESGSIISNLLSYCDGTNSILEISNFINKPFWKIKPIVDKLVDLELLDKFVIKKTTI
jgi:aminopeptidase-like protein